jgi:hypothetical protein
MLRLRQAVLVARDLDAVTGQLRAELGLGEPFHDPGVARFGLGNAVMALGDTFVEVVSPTTSGTAAARYLERRGGDGGYMAMFELDDVDSARRRAAEAGVREVSVIDLPDILDVHLHPRDMGGAIVALDRAVPPGSWRWGGPEWEGRIPAHGRETLVGATVGVAEPESTAERWAHVLGASRDGMSVALDNGGELRFAASDGRGDGIVAFTVAVDPAHRAGREHLDLGGVRFALRQSARQDSTL